MWGRYMKSLYVLIQEIKNATKLSIDTKRHFEKFGRLQTVGRYKNIQKEGRSYKDLNQSPL